MAVNSSLCVNRSPWSYHVLDSETPASTLPERCWNELGYIMTSIQVGYNWNLITHPASIDSNIYLLLGTQEQG